MRRVEEPDSIYRTEPEKYEAIVADILEKQQQGRPVLVGTVSIEKSERLSTMLKRRGIKHVVLNAKYHAQEAEIVAQAGRKGAVTIATNMAGRGTDILLGGNAEYMARQQASPRKSPSGSRRARRASSTTSSSSTSSTSTSSIACRAPTGSASSRTSAADRGRARGGGRARRPAHPRHRAARGAAHRQPAARPRRPAGRSRARRASICRSKTT